MMIDMIKKDADIALTEALPLREPNGGGQPPESASPDRPVDWLFRVVPALDSLRIYSWRSLRLDFFPGLTVAAVTGAHAVAFTSIPHLTPPYRLYTPNAPTPVCA